MIDHLPKKWALDIKAAEERSVINMNQYVCDQYGLMHTRATHNPMDNLGAGLVFLTEKK